MKTPQEWLKIIQDRNILHGSNLSGDPNTGIMAYITTVDVEYIQIEAWNSALIAASVATTDAVKKYYSNLNRP